MRRVRLFGPMVFAAFSVGILTARAGEPLWDNGLIPNGVNGRALSPPAFPDIRVDSLSSLHDLPEQLRIRRDF